MYFISIVLWYADLASDKNKSSDDGGEHFKNTIKLESGRDISNYSACIHMEIYEKYVT